MILRHVFNPYQTYFESTYTNPRTGKIKTTTVWAAEVQGDAKVTIQPEEIMSYAWVGVDNAQHLLSWMEDKEIMQKLVMLLNVETSRSDSMLNA